MSSPEIRVTGMQPLDHFVSLSHSKEMFMTGYPIGVKIIRDICGDPKFLNTVNTDMSHRQADWTDFSGQMSAILGIRLAINLGIPCLEYDETKREKPDLGMYSKYVLLRRVRNPIPDQNPFTILRTEVHTPDKDYLITLPSNDKLINSPTLTAGSVSVKEKRNPQRDAKDEEETLSDDLLTVLALTAGVIIAAYNYGTGYAPRDALSDLIAGGGTGIANFLGGKVWAKIRPSPNTREKKPGRRIREITESVLIAVNPAVIIAVINQETHFIIKMIEGSSLAIANILILYLARKGDTKTNPKK